jgi:hypothetical protein
MFRVKPDVLGLEACLRFRRKFRVKKDGQGLVRCLGFQGFSWSFPAKGHNPESLKSQNNYRDVKRGQGSRKTKKSETLFESEGLDHHFQGLHLYIRNSTFVCQLRRVSPRWRARAHTL